MDQLGKRTRLGVEEICPVCGMCQTEWSASGVRVNGTDYCCRGCAVGTGCTCRLEKLTAPKQKADYEDRNVAD